ncbi:Pyr redox 2 domain-containing protein [Citrus sinensis]|uniref:Pyr redox 2 domain-containing protein n=1 Tax=Citrus sinensis TaxID=2711 RepID=A0ACB8L750_CITSI|nr:Pyr redox 2 domain-containing protein [Citrus sinensis]
MCVWLWGSTAAGLVEKKKVVVIGGGVGGSLLAYHIQSFADVVLIDEKEYFEITWASLRAVVEPSFAVRSVINHSDYLSNVEIVVSTAVSITDTEVVTAGGQTFVYDYVVVATGHVESVPKSRTERLSQYEKEFEKLKSANSVLVVGGGPTGVELAGEIAVDFPDKKVILVHRGPKLLEFVGSRASQIALDWLTSKKVEVILNQSVTLNTISDGRIETSSGETINADCHFMCTGKAMASSWLRETILKDSLDSRGRLMVYENLRVRGFKNVFAIGDITDIPHISCGPGAAGGHRCVQVLIPVTFLQLFALLAHPANHRFTMEIKQGYLAQKHALVTAKNLKKLMMGRNKGTMATYKPGYPIALVSLGRREGVAHFPFLTISGRIPGWFKSRDLFVGKTRKQLGLKPTVT